jgi:hypothetical protein
MPPAKDGVNCCCQREGALPDKTGRTSDSLGITFSGICEYRYEQRSSPITVVASAPSIVGPRLHILLCVWRC